MKLSSLRVICMLALCAGFLGCAKSGPQVVPVSGIVTRNGKPVPKAFLEFQPAEGRTSWGVSDNDGKFTLEYSRSQMGARTGPHTVTVSFRPGSIEDEIARNAGKLKVHPDAKKIEEKYGPEGTNPYQVEITKATSDLEIKLD